MTKLKKATIQTKYCVACGACAKSCPKTAIHIIAGTQAEVDQVICVGCGKCVNICPINLICLEEMPNV